MRIKTKKQAILIHSFDIERDIKLLKKYTSVKEYEPYKEVRGAGFDGGQWHLLIMGASLNWKLICDKHKINYPDISFNIKSIKPFFVKVIKCSNYCKNNKDFIGKTMQVMIDPINSSYYSIYPPLPIQILCNNDGNYSRKGYTYGIAVDDCVKTSVNLEKFISDEWKIFLKSLPKKAPNHFTLKSLHAINKIINK